MNDENFWQLIKVANLSSTYYQFIKVEPYESGASPSFPGEFCMLSIFGWSRVFGPACSVYSAGPTYSDGPEHSTGQTAYGSLLSYVN